MTPRTFYISRENQTYGPYSESDLRQMIADGSVVQTDLACDAADEDWRMLANIIEIAPPRKAKRVVKIEFAGAGCAVQALGLLVIAMGFGLATIDPVIGILAGLVGLAFLAVGSRMARKLNCSECGNRVEKTSKICPVCKVRL